MNACVAVLFRHRACNIRSDFEQTKVTLLPAT
jgi:hypothetical protein